IHEAPGVIAIDMDPPDPARDPEGYFPGVDLDALSAVRDQTVHRSAEAKSRFNLLEVLKNTDPAELDRYVSKGEMQGEVSYRQLFYQPKVYRGRLVRFKAVVRRAFELRAPKNSVGIDRFYQLWVTPDEHNVIAIYSLELPKGFPLSRVKNKKAKEAKEAEEIEEIEPIKEAEPIEEIEEPEPIKELEEDAEFVGFFFKLWVYEAEQGISSAPLVLVGSLKWTPLVEEPPPPPIPMPWLVAMLGGAMAVGVCAAVLAYMAGNWRAEEADRARQISEDPKAIGALDAMEAVPDADEQFRRLADAMSEEESMPSPEETDANPNADAKDQA
ncbi:MAG: hypothetical protein N2C14_34300, partial [Planctomycetales bacterium]